MFLKTFFRWLGICKESVYQVYTCTLFIWNIIETIWSIIYCFTSFHIQQLDHIKTTTYAHFMHRCAYKFEEKLSNVDIPIVTKIKYPWNNSRKNSVRHLRTYNISPSWFHSVLSTVNRLTQGGLKYKPHKRMAIFLKHKLEVITF